MRDSFTQRTFIGDDDIEVHPMKIRDKDLVIRLFSQIYSEDQWFLNLLDETAYKKLLSLLFIAFGRDHSKEAIEGMMDAKLSLEVISVFKEISQLKNTEGESNDVDAPQWNQLYASLIQNTSLKMDDILDLTLAQLEELLEGIALNNAGSSGGGGGSKDRLEDTDALRYLLDNGGKI